MPGNNLKPGHDRARKISQIEREQDIRLHGVSSREDMGVGRVGQVKLRLEIRVRQTRGIRKSC